MCLCMDIYCHATNDTAQCWLYLCVWGDILMNRTRTCTWKLVHQWPMYKHRWSTTVLYRFWVWRWGWHRWLRLILLQFLFQRSHAIIQLLNAFFKCCHSLSKWFTIKCPLVVNVAQRRRYNTVTVEYLIYESILLVACTTCLGRVWARYIILYGVSLTW